MNNLMKTFRQIATQSGKLDALAGGILEAIRAAQADTVEKFDDMVREAYEANGWSYGRGRRPAGVETKPAPDAIRVYVSQIRAAYALGLDIYSYSTISALRIAVREHRQRDDENKDSLRLPELRGLSLRQHDELNGALFHDAAVIYAHLPQAEREELRAKLDRLIKKYSKALPDDLPQAA